LKRSIFVSLVMTVTAAISAAQSNPVPFVNQPLVPTSAVPSGAGFTLTVNGTGFVSGSTINWNGSALATTFASRNQLTATIPCTANTASLTVISPAPGGGTSSVVYFPVATPESSLYLYWHQIATPPYIIQPRLALTP
jgi:hypothetical protein